MTAILELDAIRCGYMMHATLIAMMKIVVPEVLR